MPTRGQAGALRGAARGRARPARRSSGGGRGAGECPERSQRGPEDGSPPALGRPSPKPPRRNLDRAAPGGGGYKGGAAAAPSAERTAPRGSAAGRTHRGTMRIPLLLLLALLALLATDARAEEGQETVRTRFQGLVRKAQEHIANFRASDAYQQLRELSERCIERTLNAVEQVKTHISNLLKRSP